MSKEQKNYNFTAKLILETPYFLANELITFTLYEFEFIFNCFYVNFLRKGPFLE